MTLCPLCPGQQQRAFIGREGGCEKPPRALLHTHGRHGPWDHRPVGWDRGCKAQKTAQQTLNCRLGRAFQRRSGLPWEAVRTDHSEVADLGSASSGATGGRLVRSHWGPGTSFTHALGGQGWLSRDLGQACGWDTPTWASRASLPTVRGGGCPPEMCPQTWPSHGCPRPTSTHTHAYTHPLTASRAHSHQHSSTRAHVRTLAHT